jgi:AraC-like DNA-binding protein
MSLASLDLVLRAASVALLLVLAASLLRDFGKVISARLAVALALGSAVHAGYAFGVTAPLPSWHAPLIAVSTGNVVVLWLLTRALFDDGFRLRWWHGAIWASVAAFSVLNCLWIAPVKGSERLSVIAINLLALGFIALAVGQAIASWSNDLVEGRRRLRALIVGAAALYAGVNAVLQILVSDRGAADFAGTANAALLAGVVATITWSMMRVEGAELFASVPAAVHAARERDAKPDLSGGDQKLVDALMRLMADERVYRYDNITIGALASKLGIPEYRLRRLINQRLGYRNFSVFLNNHRIEEAKAALADPTQAEVPVITIAMDAGFQSLGPFNRAFKSTTGLTPTQYRRLQASLS